MCWEELSGKNAFRENDFKEVRLHKTKPPEEYSCRLLHREKNYLVLYYYIHNSFRIKDIQIEKGSSTIAHYWQNRNYVLWKFKDSRRRLLGYLFHVCNSPEIRQNLVTYEDLELDIWFGPDGTGYILDQDEVNDFCARGLIDSREHALIDEQKSHILKNFQNIIEAIWTEEK